MLSSVASVDDHYSNKPLALLNGIAEITWLDGTLSGATAVKSKSLWSWWKLFLFSEGLKVLVFDLSSKCGEASQ